MISRHIVWLDGGRTTADTKREDGWVVPYRHTRRGLRTRLHRIEFFGIPKGSRILDYGCGDGLDLHCFHALGYSRAIGIDRSQGLLAAVADAPVVLGDAERTPFGDGSFDAVYVNAVLHHLRFERALAEIRRILRPGGLLCLVEQRAGWPRRLVDLITFSPLGASVPLAQIRHRRAALLYEMDEYRAWLRREAHLESDLRQHGFSVTARRETLLSVLLNCSRE